MIGAKRSTRSTTWRFLLAGGYAAAAVSLVTPVDATASRTAAGAAPPMLGVKLISVSADRTDDAWAVGLIKQDGHMRPYTVHWDGNGWQEVAAEDPETRSKFLSVSALSPDDAWAVGASDLLKGPDSVYHGQTLVEHWDGTTWTRVDSENRGALRNQLNAVVALSPSKVWAVGYQRADDEDSSKYMVTERWNGTGFTVVHTGISEDYYSNLLDIDATQGSNVLVGGVDTHYKARIHRLHDGVWSRVPAPGPLVHGISALSAVDAWAVGGLRILHWNGTTWRHVHSPTLGVLTSVSAAGAFDVWAASASGFAHWDGTTWSEIEDPGVGAISDISAVSPDDAWAVGQDGAGGLIEHWDGTAWTVVV